MALKSCPNCGHQISDKATKCPNCGNNPNNKPVKKRSSLIMLIVGIICLVVSVAVILTFLYMQKNSSKNNYSGITYVTVEPTETESFDEVEADEEDFYDNEDAFEYYQLDENEVRFVLQSYCDAVANNDFNALNHLYAPFVERYHNAYKMDRSDVVEDHRKYDEMFKVYGKHSHIRWNTFEVKPLGNGRTSATIVEDYSIDREDKDKYSNFVLEKHFELNDDYQIVSVWDNQLSRSK